MSQHLRRSGCDDYRSGNQTTIYRLTSSFFFFKHSSRMFGKQNVLHPSIGPANGLSSRRGSCSNRFCVISFVVADFAPRNTFGVFSVRIRMQSYYTLEGLSHSRRMAMNFKCGIKAFRVAFTWGRLTQFRSNWVFIYLLRKRRLWQQIVNRKYLFLFRIFSAAPPNKTAAGTKILPKRTPRTPR